MNQELTLKRLTVETLHDFLDYFDHRAFLNDEDWAGCYCQAYLHPSDTPEEEVFGPGKAREAACNKVAAGEMDGYLAYDNEKLVGWCAAASSLLFQAIPDADEKVARIVCFNIDPDFREQGLAGKILDLVITDLIERGFAAIEAAPRSEELTPKSFQGTVSMFEKRGFEKIIEFEPGHHLMRRHLD